MPVSTSFSCELIFVASKEYQSLHPDAIWGILDGHVADQKLPPAVTVPPLERVHQFTLVLRHEPYYDLLSIALVLQVIRYI